MNISLSPFASENMVPRAGSGSLVSCQPAHLHAQAESGAYLQLNSSRFPRRRSFIYFKPPYVIGSVARFLFFCPGASEQRVSHTEVVALPCTPLSAQGAGETLLWLMFVALSADPATQNHAVSNL